MRKYSFILPLLLTFFVSCTKVDEPNIVSESTDEQTNKWLYDNMAHYYLWNTKLPDYEKTHYALAPEPYFNSLLYITSDRSGDRYFSRISEITDNGGFEASVLKAENRTYQNDLGVLVRHIVNNSGSVIGIQILYVVPGSPADKQGLKRGDIFNKYNDINVSSNSQGWSYLSTVRLSMCTSSFKQIKDVTITKTKYLNDPILASDVLDISGRKVAYLAYTHFTTGDNNVFQERLNVAFEKFKQAGVSDLILDLRYNPGGELTIVQRLASMIAPRETVERRAILARTEYNSIYGEELKRRDSEYNLLRFSLTSLDLDRYNLNLDRLFVITREVTASASEVTIHCLKQYVNVVHYGSGVTVGKDLGSITITDPKKSVKWEIHPIVTQIYNNVMGPSYKNGLVPNRQVSENNGDLLLGTLGDYHTEPMLRSLIENEFGVSVKSSTYSAEDHSIGFKPIEVRDLGIEL